MLPHNITESNKPNTNVYINYNHVLKNLQDYMLTSKLIIKSNQTHFNDADDKKNQKNEKQKKEKSVVKEESPFFYPKEKDSLFWCYFIIKNGFASYEYPDVSSFVNEKNEKFKLIQTLRDCKQQLKTKKIKNLKEDVEDELANKERIGMKTFIALCIADNINVLYIHKRKCFEMVFDELSPIHVVHCEDNPTKYYYEIDPTKEKIEYYRTKLFNWESVEKPLKAITSYKVDELVELCNKLDLNKENEDLKKKTKKDLYNMLVMNV
jgi:hypothetical protein